jgi:hypothetical protein
MRKIPSISGYDVAFFNRKWPQQKQFSPTFRNIVFCEAKAPKGKKNDIILTVAE